MLMVFICGWWDYGFLFFLFILCCIFNIGNALLLQSEFFFSLLLTKSWSTVVNLRSKLRRMNMEKGVSGGFRESLELKACGNADLSG